MKDAIVEYSGLFGCECAHCGTGVMYPVSEEDMQTAKDRADRGLQTFCLVTCSQCDGVTRILLRPN